MITAHIIGLALMAMPHKSEPAPEWKPSTIDTKKLQEGMKEFQVKMIDGRKYYPFEQYAASKGIIRLSNETGCGFYVSSPFEWRRLSETKELLSWQNERDQEALFASFPEEQEAYESRIQSFFKESRKLLEGMQITHN